MPDGPVVLSEFEIVVAPFNLEVFREQVGKERVENVFATGWGDDGKFLEFNIVVEFSGGQISLGVCPIPVWGTESRSSSTPSLDVGVVFLCGFQRGLLESLLYVEYRQNER